MISTVRPDSDRIKATSYHEFTRAIQYRQSGHSFYRDLVIAEINAGGHGDEDSDDADLISIVESWAHHLGFTYADRTYEGIRVSGRIFSWLGLLERDINEEPNHIPEGLYHDLVDNTNDGDPDEITDNVSGFTNQQLFSCMTSDVRSIEAFRTCLINNHLAGSGNSLTQLDELFDSY